MHFNRNDTVIAGAVIPFRGEMTQPDYRISDTFPYEVFGVYPIVYCSI